MTASSYGFATPTGSDLIRDGDDAIRLNAQKAVDLYLEAMAKANIKSRNILNNEDLNDIRTPQLLRYTSATGVANLPPWDTTDTIAHQANILVLSAEVTGGDAIATQVAFRYGPRPAIAWRTARTTAGVWQDWQIISDKDITRLKALASTGGTTTLTSTEAGLRNALLREDFTRRVRPPAVTAQAVIAFRFDHGLANYNTKIRPLLQARGWPSTITLNARDWGRPENAGVTAAMVDAWTDVEVTNHGAHHNDASGETALWDAIVNGLTELQAQLPNHAIDGWMPPGTSGTRYDDYRGGISAAQHADHPAGPMIMAHHAYASGYVPDTLYRPLDGVIRTGERHYTMDVARLDQVQTIVNEAITQRAGLCLMIHPSLVDTTGHMSLATFTAVLDWLKTRETAGDIQIMTVGQLVQAKRS